MTEYTQIYVYLGFLVIVLSVMISVVSSILQKGKDYKKYTFLTYVIHYGNVAFLLFWLFTSDYLQNDGFKSFLFMSLIAISFNAGLHDLKKLLNLGRRNLN